MKRLFNIWILIMLILAGCGSTRHEIITGNPPEADIYWGKTQDALEKSGHKTPYSGSNFGLNLKHNCYQVKKEGYHDSDIICRQKEKYRHIEFNLSALKTMITSEPSRAKIYWGPTVENLKETIHETPRTESNVLRGVSWKDWYFQVKKEGFHDSSIIFKPKTSKDRSVHFVLKPIHSDHHTSENKANEYTLSDNQLIITWDDMSTDEAGFKIERKDGEEGSYRNVATVGANATTYTDKGLIPGVTYYYRVSAYNSSGNSLYSNEIRVDIASK